MTMTTDEKVRENRLRREARRRRHVLIKSTRQDPNAFDYGKYVLLPLRFGEEVPKGGSEIARWAFSRGQGMTLDEIEAHLNEPMAHELPNEVQASRALNATAHSLEEYYKIHYEKLSPTEREAFTLVRQALSDIAAKRRAS